MAFRVLNLGGLFSLLQPYQGNPPDVRGVGQRALSQTGVLPELANASTKGLPAQHGDGLNGWPVRFVAVMPGEVPGNLDLLA